MLWREKNPAHAPGFNLVGDRSRALSAYATIGTLYRSPLVINAQTIRAVLLASATASTLVVRRVSSTAPAMDAPGRLHPALESGQHLIFGDGDPHWNEPTPVRQRTGEFCLYDEYDPRRTILFYDDGEVWKDDAFTGTLYSFFLKRLTTRARRS